MACEVSLVRSEQKYLVLDFLHLPIVPFLPLTPLYSSASIGVYEHQGYKVCVSYYSVVQTAYRLIWLQRPYSAPLISRCNTDRVYKFSLVGA